MTKTEPLVRIRVVAERTGVPEPTLRAWERRYGIPAPQRTPSGYRLYGVREIAQVETMRDLCNAGVAASEAARQTLDKRLQQPPADRWRAARDAVLTSLDAFDVDAFELHVQNTMFLGDGPAILQHFVEPVLREVGERWHKGELTIAQEHFASFRLGVVLRDLVRQAQVANDAPRVLLAAFAEEDHELGLLALATQVGHWGYRPVFLGARTPPSAIRVGVQAVSPIAVALSLTMRLERGHARELLGEYAAACGRTAWFVGGPGLASLEELVTAAGGISDPGDELHAALDGLRRKRR